MMEIKYINAYAVDRRYGGPEEGGWWYDTGTPLASVPCRDDEDACIALEQRRLKELFNDEFPNKRGRGSVIGGPDLEIIVEEHFAEPFPKEKPHYE